MHKRYKDLFWRIKYYENKDDIIEEIKMHKNPDESFVLSESLWEESTEKTYRTCTMCCMMGARNIRVCPLCNKYLCEECLEKHAPKCIENNKERK